MSKRGHFSYPGHPPDTLINEQASRPRKRLVYRELLLDSGNFSSGNSDNPTFVFNKPISADYYSVQSVVLPLNYNYISDQQFIAVRFIWEQFTGIETKPVFLTVRIGGPSLGQFTTGTSLINYIQAQAYNNAGGNQTFQGLNPILFASGTNLVLGGAGPTLNWYVYPYATVTRLDANNNFIWDDVQPKTLIVFNATGAYTSNAGQFPQITMTKNPDTTWSLVFNRMFLLTTGSGQLGGNADLLNSTTDENMYDSAVLAASGTANGIVGLNYMEIDFTAAPDLAKAFGVPKNTVERYLFAPFFNPPPGPMEQLLSTTLVPPTYFQGGAVKTNASDLALKEAGYVRTPAITQTINSTDINYKLGVPPNQYEGVTFFNSSPDDYLLLRSNALSGGAGLVGVADANELDVEKPSNIIKDILFPGAIANGTLNVVYETDKPTVPDCMNIFKGRMLDKIDLYWTNSRTETGVTFNGYNFMVIIGLLSVELFD